MTSAIERKDLPSTTLFGVPMELKLSRSDAAGEIEGYGSIFGNVDQGGDIVVKGAFQDSLARHKANGTAPAMLWQHQPDQPIGTWHDVSEDSKGLLVRGKINLDVKAGQEARSLLLGKSLKGLSIGFQTKEAEIDRQTGVRRLKKLELWEISLVTFAMNPQARITEAKGLGIERDVEKFLRDAGLSRSQAKAFVASGMKGIANLLPENDQLLATVKAATAELERIQK
jgi:HK97 family phage prohead protease